MLHRLQKALSVHRFQHSLQVADLAQKLARVHGADVHQAQLAGQFHDCAREFSIEKLQKLVFENHLNVEDFEVQNPVLLHSPVGAWVAGTEYGIQDTRVLSAIRWHSLGQMQMTVLEKIIFVADYCSADRQFPEAESIRAAALNDLDQAVYLKFVTEKRHNDSQNRQNSPMALQYLQMHPRSYS